MAQIQRPFVISADTTCDFTPEFLAEKGILLHPLHYIIDGEEYGLELDKEQPKLKDFYRMLREGATPTTSATSIDYDIKLFEKAVEAGNDIIHFPLASALSASWSNANVAAKEVMERHPEARIEVVDACSGSSGLALMVLGAWERMKEGKTINETLEWIEKSIKNLKVYFSVSSLMTLYRGGRLKKSTAIFGTALKIQPMLKIFPDGSLGAIGKVRGRAKAIEGLADYLAESKEKGTMPSRVAIAHGDCEDEAHILESLVRDRYGIDDIIILDVSPTLGSHTGPGVLIFGFIDGE